MTMTMGMIDCTTKNYKEVKIILEQWLTLHKHRKGIFYVVPSMHYNFYGGVKVGLLASVKDDYYGMVSEILIKDFESLMSALPFSRALLFHEGSGGVTAWFLDTEKNRKIYKNGAENAIIEPTSIPHICKQTRASTHELPTVVLTTMVI